MSNSFATSWTVTRQAHSVHEISQARILEWVVISFSRASSRPRDWTRVSCVSCIGKQILYLCTTWETPTHWFKLKELLIITSNCSRRLYTKNKGTPSSLTSHRTALVTASYELILAGTFRVFIYSFPHPWIELCLILHYFAHSFFNLVIRHLSLTAWKDSPHWFWGCRDGAMWVDHPSCI